MGEKTSLNFNKQNTISLLQRGRAESEMLKKITEGKSLTADSICS